MVSFVQVYIYLMHLLFIIICNSKFFLILKMVVDSLGSYPVAM